MRNHGVPLGYVQLPNRAEDLEFDAVALAVASSPIGLSVWSTGAARRWRHDSGGVGNGRAALDPVPAISVVVCTRDRPHSVRLFLAAMAQQTYGNYEVVVVDNASRELSTRAVAEEFGARYVTEPRPGLDYARNAGWRSCSSGIIAYADDDTTPDPDWLTAIAAGFASPDVAAVTGLVVPAELETFAQILYEDVAGGMGRGFRLMVHSRRGRAMTYRGNEYGIGANMAFRRAALEQVGGFDPALGAGTPTAGGDEFDMFQRLLEADGAICYRPDAVVRHVHRRTVDELRRQLFDAGRGFTAFYIAALARARGFDRVRVLRDYASWLKWLGGRFVQCITRRDPLPLRLRSAEVMGALLGPLYYVSARRRARRIERAYTRLR